MPTTNGFVAKSIQYGAVSDATIQDFITWAHANGVKVLLTVYNGDDGWNWTLARQGFEFNRNRFTTALVAEMQRLGLDGIDLDLEADYGVPLRERSARRLRVLRQGARAARASAREAGDGRQLSLRLERPERQLVEGSLPLRRLHQFDGLRGARPLRADLAEIFLAEGGRRRLSRQARDRRPLLRGVWQGNLATTHLDWFLTAGAGRTGVAIWDGAEPVVDVAVPPRVAAPEGRAARRPSGDLEASASRSSADASSSSD